MRDDWLRAGGSMWLDSLLYDPGQGEVELWIGDEGNGVEDDARSNREAKGRVSQ